jgi:hypothetical protein
MNNLLSAISGQFSKSLLLSTMLPVVVFLVLAWVLVVPLIPQSVTWRAWAGGLNTEWQVAALSLVVFLLTALLYNLNGLVIRAYEGYPWRRSKIGKYRTDIHQKRFNHAQGRWKSLRVLLGRKGARDLPGYSEARKYWNWLGRELNTRFPTKVEAVLPTHLGNVLRSFEDYPNRQYGLEAITLWPRLVSKIDERYAAQIDDAKSSMDFMLNSSLLCGLLAALFGIVRLYYPVALADLSALAQALVVIAVLLGGSYFFYALSLSWATAWGNLVKGAFDLYRWDLLQALGPWERPAGREEEEALWDKVSNLLIYSDLTTTPPPDYQPAVPLTAATVTRPETLALEVTRGARAPLLGQALMINIQVRNPNPTQQATGVSVQDRLPEGWLLEWGSAQTVNGPVEVLGTNPYRFHLGNLEPEQSVLLIYRAIPGPAPVAARKGTPSHEHSSG